MQDKKWQPQWWTQDKHESGWERVKEAMKRDWVQTKSDFGAGGRELDQDVDDTLKQAAGKDAIPPAGTPNAPGGSPAALTTCPRCGGVTRWIEAATKPDAIARLLAKHGLGPRPPPKPPPKGQLRLAFPLA